MDELKTDLNTEEVQEFDIEKLHYAHPEYKRLRSNMKNDFVTECKNYSL